MRCAVIGGGIGGLTAAAELARRSVETVVFEATSELGGKARVFREDGCTFDTGPTLLTLPGVVAEQFRRLGCEELLPRFLRLELQTDYRFPDGTAFLCHEDLERSAASAEAIEPGEGAGLRRFARAAEAIYEVAGRPYLEAPFTGLPAYLAQAVLPRPAAALRGLPVETLAALARRCFRSEPLRCFAGRFATYAGASPFRASAAFAMIPHIERAFGTHHVEGGMGALVRALEAAAARLGVVVRRGCAARWERRQGRWYAGPPAAPEPFDAVIVNRDPLDTLGRSREPLALSGYAFFGIVDRRLTLPHHAVIFAKDYEGEFATLFRGELPDELTLYVCHPAATDASMAPSGRSGLYLMVNAPALRDPQALAAAWTPERRAAVQARALELLRRHWPELRAAQVRVAGDQSPVELAALGAPGGSIYGFLPHGLLGAFRRPRQQAEAPGLYFAGGGTYPGGGVPLVMLSGRFAAQLALERATAT